MSTCWWLVQWAWSILVELIIASDLLVDHFDIQFTRSLSTIQLFNTTNRQRAPKYIFPLSTNCCAIDMLCFFFEALKLSSRHASMQHSKCDYYFLSLSSIPIAYFSPQLFFLSYIVYFFAKFNFFARAFRFVCLSNLHQTNQFHSEHSGLLSFSRLLCSATRFKLRAVALSTQSLRAAAEKR